MGMFQFKFLLFGLHNSAQTMQKLMDRLFGGLPRGDTFWYIGDI